MGEQPQIQPRSLYQDVVDELREEKEKNWKETVKRTIKTVEAKRRELTKMEEYLKELRNKTPDQLWWDMWDSRPVKNETITTI